MNLIERIRAARQTRVEHAGKTFIVRRPTDWEAYEMRSGSVKELDLLEKYVDGWENITELDLVPGGSSDPVEFDRALFTEWIQDQTEFWAPLIGAITAEYQAHALRQAESEKK